jgi:acetyl esterase/lipase
VTAALLLLAAWAQQVPPAVAPAAAPAFTVERDLAYAAEDPAQRLDFYRPSATAYPIVVFVYGGGWHSGSGRSCAPVAEVLARAGFGVALVSHRLTPPQVWPVHARDVAAAFAWTRAHAAERGGDPKRIFLAGHSSGAQLALIVASDGRFLSAHDLVPKDVAGVFALSPPVDLAPRKDGRGYGDALLRGHGADAFSRDGAVLKDASPIAHLSKELPRSLLIVGDRDFPMLPADVAAYAARAEEAGAKVATFVAKGCDHLGTVAALADAKSEVAKRVLEFLREGGTR